MNVDNGPRLYHLLLYVAT